MEITQMLNIKSTLAGLAVTLLALGATVGPANADIISDAQDSGTATLAGCFAGNINDPVTFDLTIGGNTGLIVSNGDKITVNANLDWDFGDDIDPACYTLAVPFLNVGVISNAADLDPALVLTVDGDGTYNLPSIAGQFIATYEFTVDVPNGTVLNLSEGLTVEATFSAIFPTTDVTINP